MKHVPADVPKSWSEKGESWSTTSSGFPICRRRATTFVDPRRDYGLDEWPHRTTNGLSDTGWGMIEVCESMKDMETLSEKVESRWKQIINHCVDHGGHPTR